MVMPWWARFPIWRPMPLLPLNGCSARPSPPHAPSRAGRTADTAVLDREQHRVHGLAWLATMWNPSSSLPPMQIGRVQAGASGNSKPARSNRAWRILRADRRRHRHEPARIHSPRRTGRRAEDQAAFSEDAAVRSLIQHGQHAANPRAADDADQPKPGHSNLW